MIHLRMIDSGEMINANESFALRLIEQGKAIPMQEDKPKTNAKGVKRSDAKAEEGGK